jgi:type 1 glutamine amidotransferase
MAGNFPNEKTKKPQTDPDFKPAIDYGKGRIFYTTLGHDVPAFEGVGFITTFQRGCEWAASGKVTLPVPKDFSMADAVSSRTFNLEN